MIRKYPSTLYWPWSPAYARDGKVHPDPLHFVGKPVVATEKLDGGNTLLHAGNVYSRSVSTPSNAGWMAMVKKHHAWKVTEQDIHLYGEDIYGVHSITYDPVPEDRTFHAFALRDGSGTFSSFAELETYADSKNIPIVPVLFRGCFQSIEEIRTFLEQAHMEPSQLGGEREGIVLRLAHGFPEQEFQLNVCKSVRAGHVQSSIHWSRNWKPCQIARDPR